MRRGRVRAWAKEAEEPWGAAIAGNACLRGAMMRALGDEVARAFDIHAAAALLDIKRFYDSLSLEKIAKAAAEFGYPVRILALSLELHLSPRFLRLDNRSSLPLYADRSPIAGARRSNNLARAFVYYVMRQCSGRISETRPRARFDDTGVQTFGAEEAVKQITLEPTGIFDEELTRQDLEVAADAANDPRATEQIATALDERDIQIDGDAEGRDSGVDRASKTRAQRKTHLKGKKKAWGELRSWE